MAKSKQQKSVDLEELTDKLKDAKGIVFASYGSSTVKDIEKLRKAFYKEGVFAKVYKMTLIRKALESQGIDASSVDFKTPTLMAIGTDEETAPARILKAISKEVKTVGVLSGVLDKNVMSKAQVEALADLPSKLEMRAMLVRTINAPVSGFVTVLAGNLRGLVTVLSARADKLK